MKVLLMIVAIIFAVVSDVRAANSNEDPEMNFLGPTRLHGSPFNMLPLSQPTWGLRGFQRMGRQGSGMMPSYHYRYGVPGTGAGGMAMGNPFTATAGLVNPFSSTGGAMGNPLSSTGGAMGNPLSSTGGAMGNPLSSTGAMWNNYLNQRPSWGGQRQVNPYDIASANTGYMW